MKLQQECGTCRSWRPFAKEGYGLCKQFVGFKVMKATDGTRCLRYEPCERVPKPEVPDGN